MSVPTLWPDLLVVAQSRGMIHPYDTNNAHLFRGEEAFAPEITDWRRWSKPSPEPELDETFRRLVLEALAQQAGIIRSLVINTATQMVATLTTPPLLIAILRAGVPVGALLAHHLSALFEAPVPLVALSLFEGLGWDQVALAQVLAAYPGRPVWFVDGWTSQGGVARELQASYQRWLAQGFPDFTQGQGPRLAVLCDPQGFAQATGARGDCFIPSACFTAPETLGFSRGFASGEGHIFQVYEYPPALVQPSYLSAWLEIAHTPPHPLPPGLTTAHAITSPPAGWRIHINEVTRALINRAPHEVLFQDDAQTVAGLFAPVLYLCQWRQIPVRYGQTQLASWGTLAAAQMKRAKATP